MEKPNIEYDLKEHEVQLLDLNLDPYETTHFTDSKKHQPIMKQLEEDFEMWFPYPGRL